MRYPLALPAFAISERQNPGAAMLALGAIAMGYASSTAPWFVAVVLISVLAALWAPAGVVAAIPAVIGITYEPLRAGRLEFAPAETLIVALVLGVGLRLLFQVASTGPTKLLSAARATVRAQASLMSVVALGLLAAGTLSLATLALPAYRHESLRFYRWVILEPLVYFALAGYYLRPRANRQLAAALFVAGGVFVALTGLLDLARGSGVAVEGVLRISGVYPHPNALALYLERPLVFAVVLGLAYRRPVAWGWLLPGALMGVVLLFTFSRGALLAAGIAVVLSLWLAGRRRLAGGLILAGLGGGVAIALTATARIANLFSGGSGSLRLDVWRSALDMVRAHPVFGIGLDQFLYVYTPRYVQPAAWSERFTSHPHDLILDLWLSLGILGVIVAAGYAFVLVHRAIRTRALRSSLAAAAIAAIVAGILHGLVDNGYFLPDLALVWWFLTALIEAELRPGVA